MPTNFKELHVGRKVVDVVFGEGVLDVCKGLAVSEMNFRARFNAGTDDEHLQWYSWTGRMKGKPGARRSLYLKGEEPEVLFPVICEPLEPAPTFPVHPDEHNWRKTVPLALVEKCRDQLHENHHQSLKMLAERGGLSSVEIWLAYNGHGLNMVKTVTVPEAQSEIDFLIANWGNVDA